MQSLPEKITRQTLLELSERHWNTSSEYDWIAVFPTGKRHESGYSLLAIVGVRFKETKDAPATAEIAAVCDDVVWKGRTDLMHTDCFYQSGGVLRFWGNYARFRVGDACSSTDVEIVERKAHRCSTIP